MECGLSFNAITLTTLYHGQCITTVRNTVHQGININILVQIQQIILNVERQRHSDERDEHTVTHIEKQLDDIDRTTYPNMLTAFFVAISFVTLVAGFCAMHTRMYLSAHHFNPFVVVIITAFVATLLGAMTYFLQLGIHADVAVASSVLLLVPSFPIINALSDILKGYINMGLGRWMFATMLTLSACVGIVIALIFLRIPHWGL